MPCYYPLQGYRSQTVNPSGKRSIVFNVNEGYKDLPVEVPCGQCIGCRLARSVEWAVRCVHHSQSFQDNCFITLTYEDRFLPKNGTLRIDHWQKFMKKLRKKVDRKISYFHCGEYGEKFSRPHYHACLFNYDFPDKQFYKEVNGEKYFISDILEDTWGYGFATIGAVTFKSAAYVARYVLKKITGERAKFYYEGEDEETGESFSLRKEYVTMSRRPGIGKDWFEKYKGDLFPDDFAVIGGKKYRVPKYYVSKLEVEFPSDYRRLRGKRALGREKGAANNTHERLVVREEVQRRKFELLKRGYEDGS